MNDLQGVLGVYRSSAGSGKTYTLTRLYLGLALRSPEYFRHILAVTFTNKATQEMKSRIVMALDELHRETNPTLTKTLSEDTGLLPPQLRERAGEVLSALLHQYSHFSVSTIDSFFQRVIRAFAREIGLQGGYTVELEQQKVLEDLVDRVMESAGEPGQKALTNWLVEFARDRLEEGANWDVRRELLTLGREIFQEQYKQLEPEIQEHSGDPKALIQLHKELTTVKKRFENAVKNYGQQAQLVLEHHGLTVDNFKYKAAGPVGFLLRQTQPMGKSSGSWTYAPTKRAETAYTEPETLLNKKATAPEEQAGAELHGVLVKLLDYVQAEAIQYQTAVAVLRNFYSYGILSALAQRVREYRDENEVMLISDTGVFLKRIIADNDTPFVYEKVGAFFRHFLIDEFQDTSAFQWDNFRPLVSNSLDQDYFNLVVGDVKQSIYRWRGGDWRLLMEQINTDVGAYRVKDTALDTNWRSLPEVIAFNNTVFAEAPEWLATWFAGQLTEDAPQRLQDMAQMLKQAYADAFQKVPDQKDFENLGVAEIEFVMSAESEEEDAGDDPQMALVPQWMEELQDLGYPLKDMAFLVRTKREGQKLADYLLHYAAHHGKPGYRYSVVSSEALALESAPAVRVVVYALGVLHDPNNPIALVNLVHEYQRYVQKAVDEAELHDCFAQPTEEERDAWLTRWLPDEFVAHREDLARMPLYEVVERLLVLLKVTESRGQFAYIQGFQDAVLEYVRQEQTDVGGFLQWWEDRGRTKSVQVPEQLDAARILTIHKSKGLQFRAVLMPFCNWDLDHNATQANFLWVKTDQPPLDKAGPIPVRYSSSLADTVFREEYYQEKLLALLDNLNLLYVAFTRAEEVLRVAVPHPEAKGKPLTADKLRTVGHLLWHLAPRLGENTAANWEDPKLTWGQWPAPAKTKAPEQPPGWEHYPAARWQERLRIRHTAEDFFSLAESGRAASVEYGTLAHRLLALMQTADQLDEAVATLQREGVLSSAMAEEQEQVISMVRRVIKQPLVADWFSGRWVVKTEVPILPRTGELKRLDRVMILDDHAVVVDFKTGSPQTETQERDRRQVGFYAKLLRDMGYGHVSGYLVYLQANEPIQVV